METRKQKKSRGLRNGLKVTELKAMYEATAWTHRCPWGMRFLGWDMSDPPRCPPRSHWVLAHCGVSEPLKEFGCSLQGALWLRRSSFWLVTTRGQKCLSRRTKSQDAGFCWVSPHLAPGHPGLWTLWEGRAPLMTTHPPTPALCPSQRERTRLRTLAGGWTGAIKTWVTHYSSPWSPSHVAERETRKEKGLPGSHGDWVPGGHPALQDLLQPFSLWPRGASFSSADIRRLSGGCTEARSQISELKRERKGWRACQGRDPLWQPADPTLVSLFRPQNGRQYHLWKASVVQVLNFSYPGISQVWIDFFKHTHSTATWPLRILYRFRKVTGIVSQIPT